MGLTPHPAGDACSSDTIAPYLANAFIPESLQAAPVGSNGTHIDMRSMVRFVACRNDTLNPAFPSGRSGAWHFSHVAQARSLKARYKPSRLVLLAAGRHLSQLFTSGCPLAP